VGALTRLDPIDVGVIRGPPPGLTARRSSRPHNRLLRFVSGRPSPSRQRNGQRSMWPPLTATSVRPVAGSVTGHRSV